MAAITASGSVFNTTAGSKNTTGTPAVGDLIIIVAAHSGNATPTAPTDNQSGTYTLVSSALANASADHLSVWVRTSLVTSAVLTTYTNNPGTTTGGGLAVYRVSGMSNVGSAAIRQSAKKENQASGSAGGGTMGVACLTTNPVIHAVYNLTNPPGMTVPTGYTVAANTGWATPTAGVKTCTRDSGETGTVLAWGSNSATAYGSIVVELDASVVAASTSLAPLMPDRFQPFLAR